MSRYVHRHVLVILSEHPNYDDLRDVAQDAHNGDAILHSWSKDELSLSELPDEIKEFFGEEA